jgi:probable HAF family extracellular repeat protein
MNTESSLFATRISRQLPAARTAISVLQLFPAFKSIARGRWTRVATLILFALVGIPQQLSAQQPRYKLIDMGTLGGLKSYLNDGNSGTTTVTVLNNSGTLAGWAETATPDPFPAFCFADNCQVTHAFEWHAGARTDLGALAEGLSSQANWISESGLIAGVAENGEIDPLIPGFPELRAVFWKDGQITDLGTLADEGGYESAANAVNSAGQVVGWATNTVPDSNSIIAPGFAPTQTRAFIWRDGTIKDLRTLGTGTDAIAQFINERGQVVGWSYTGAPGTCILPGGIPVPLATHSFIWDEKNGMRDLGTLPGDCVIATGLNAKGMVVGNYLTAQLLEHGFLWSDGSIQDLGGTIGGKQAGAESVNASGEVVGFASLAGEVLTHAVLWKSVGDIVDLGTLDPSECSFATSINSKTQIVGGTYDCNPITLIHAILWEAGSLYDLNALIAPGASLTLQLAEDINDRGEIAGTGVDINSKQQHAFLLVPCAADDVTDCRETSAGVSGTYPAGVPAPSSGTTHSAPARRLLHRPRGPHLPLATSFHSSP